MKKHSIKSKVFCFILSMVFVLMTVHIDTINIYAQNENNNPQQEQIYSNATVDQNFADNRILIMFKNEVSLQFKEYSTGDFSEINCKSVQDMSLSDAQRIKTKMEEIRRDGMFDIYSSQTSNNVDLVSNYNQIVCIELENAGKENVIDAIKELQKRDDVLYVGPDYEISLCNTDEDQYIPSDNNYSNQWAPGHIQLPETWNLIDNINKSTVTVGILDTGIDGYHEDLTGVIDKDYCYDFTSGNAVKTINPTDDNGHGTHVAGIIGAIGDNDIYIAGTCWNVELASLKVFGANGKGYASHLINAIEWVSANTNIKILNFSGAFTGTTTDDDGNFWFNPSDYAPLQAKISAYNGLFVCAAGNSKSNNDINAVYPANYSLSNIITVGASNNEDGLWNGISIGTNFGATTVDLFAPGFDICSLWPDNSIFNMPGTSMATPFVTGVAAILLSINPNLSPQRLKSFIINNVDGTSDGVTAFAGKCVSGGRLNAYKVVSALVNCPHLNTYYTNKTLTKHSLYCSDCMTVVSTSSHALQYTGSYTTSVHNIICTVCSYTGAESHNLYIYQDSSESGVTIKCRQCAYTYTCTDGVAEYSYKDWNGHYASCTCGCYSFVEPHSPTNYTQIESLFSHNAFCPLCGTTYLDAHIWVETSSGYRCTKCLKTTTIIPEIMSIIPDDELAALLTDLTDEELAELTLALNEDDRGRIAALLPEREDDLVTE